MFLEIKLVPCARIERCIVNKEVSITCFVKMPPSQGKANKALIKLLSRTLLCAQKDIILVRGKSSRLKLVKITHLATKIEFIKLLPSE